MLREPVGGAPEKKTNIPKSAVWYGGRSGGSWLDVIEVRGDQSFRLRVYEDFTGTMELDSWFALSSNCLDAKIPKGDFHSYVRGYDGVSVLLAMKDGRQGCRLVRVFPEEGIAEGQVLFEIDGKRVSRESFDELHKSLEVSKEFDEGEMVKAGRTKRDKHKQGYVHLRDAIDKKSGTKYQYSISTLESQTVYSLTQVKSKKKGKVNP
jgi:hypothetical protein